MAQRLLPPSLDVRPDPPDDLPREAKQVWREVVEGLAPDWFTRESHDVLAGYCVLVVRRREATAEIEAMRGVRLDTTRLIEASKELKERERDLVMNIANIANKLRLCQSSTRAGRARKPKTIRPVAAERAWG